MKTAVKLLLVFIMSSGCEDNDVYPMTDRTCQPCRNRTSGIGWVAGGYCYQSKSECESYKSRAYYICKECRR